MLFRSGLALILVLLGVWGMYGAVESFNSNLVDVPSLVGRSLEDVKSDKNVTDNFVIEEGSSQYDSAVEAGYIISQNPVNGTYESGKTITVVVSLGVKTVEVPEVTNKPREIVLLELKQLDLKTEVITEFNSEIAPGNVIKTSPETGESVPAGSVVKVYVSVESGENEIVKVPYVEGKNEATATKELQGQGLIVSVIEIYSDTVSEGLVISQSIEGLSEVESGSEIMIYISRGPAPDIPVSTTPETGGESAE